MLIALWFLLVKYFLFLLFLFFLFHFVLVDLF